MDRSSERGARDVYDTASRIVIAAAIVALIVLWLCDLLGIDTRRRIVPGVDLVKVLWLVLMAAWLLRAVRGNVRHARLLGRRLCAGCGAERLELPVDTQRLGTCPACGRGFSLVSHRHPEKARGRDFRGYHTDGHFRRAMYRAAERITKARGAIFEGELIGHGWLVLLGTYAVFWLIGKDGAPGLTVPVFIPLVAALGVWSAFYAARMDRMRSAILAERLCLDCGYSLLATPTDDDGVGRCPECDGEFALAQYEPPRAKRTG